MQSLSFHILQPSIIKKLNKTENRVKLTVFDSELVDEDDALLLMAAATHQQESIILILHPILHFLRQEENRVKLTVFDSEHIDRLSLSLSSSMKADPCLFSWRMTRTTTY